MKASETLDHRVRVARRYQRSIRVEADLADAAGIDGYVLSTTARDAIIRILDGIRRRPAMRAWSILGPYGTGKSSFATFLTMLLQHSGDVRYQAARLAFGQQWPGFEQQLQQSLEPAATGYATSVVTGQRAPLSSLVVRALAGTLRTFSFDFGELQQELDAAGSDAHEGRLSERVVAEFVSRTAKAACSVGLAGLVLVIDELGKILEWAAQDPARSDLFVLQEIAEVAARNDDAPVVVLTVLHQGYEAYAEALPETQRNEWRKVSGRFETITYIESMAHLTRLVAEAISITGTILPGQAVVASQSQKLVEHYRDASMPPVDVLNRCFPLSPVTALCIGPLFRRKFGQNERSLFAFLSSHEPMSLSNFLGDEDSDTTHLFTLDRLYDYVYANTGVRFGADAGERTWAATEQALSRLPGSAQKTDFALVKAVCILSVVGKSTRLRADATTLSIAINRPQADIDTSLQALCGRSIIVYRNYRDAYQLWDGSDTDVPALLMEAADRVRGDGRLGPRLQEALPPLPVVATRHAHETGTLRFLRARFISPSEVAGVGRASAGSGGDGELLYVVPDRPDELAGVLVSAREATRRRSNMQPVVFALPRNPDAVIEAVVQYFAVREALGAAQISDDPVARRELGERSVAAEDTVAQAIAESFGENRSGPMHWVHRGKDITISERPSKEISRIFGDVYHLTPKIRNELVNRREPSSVAAKARREVLERLVSDDTRHLEQLGITGHPPALSIYLSVLKSTGLHAEGDDGVWNLVKPTADPLKAVWTRIREYLESQPRGRASVADLLAMLELPPFGIRGGVAPILVVAFYLTHEEELFFYEDNSLVPRMTDDFPARIVRSPKSIELQFVGDGSNGVAVARALASDSERAGAGLILRVVRRIVREINGLSPFASTTQRLSERARRMRGAIRGARDPVDLLANEIPTALGGDSKLLEGTAEFQGLAARYNDAIAELRQADDDLLGHVSDMIGKLFGVAGDSEVVCQHVVARATAVSDTKSHVPQLRRFVTVCRGADAGSPEGRKLWLLNLAAAVVGKAPTNWSDDDVSSFDYGLHQLVRQFRGAEALGAESGDLAGVERPAYRLAVVDRSGAERSVVALGGDKDDSMVPQFERFFEEMGRTFGVDQHGVYAALSRYLVEQLSRESDTETP